MHIEKRKNKPFDFPKYFDDEATRLKFDLGLPNLAPMGTTLPAINIDEMEEGYIVEMAVPGMQPEDFIVDLKNDILTIKANAPVSKRKGKKTRRREFNYRAFQRTLRLPADIDPRSGIEANYVNGVLEIMISRAA